jgi:hypothetical protein
VDFKIPDLITKEWLWEQEPGCCTNAECIVSEGDLSVIPDELYGEFLTVHQEGFGTVFSSLCTAEWFIKEIPSKYFTLENLLSQDNRRISPLACLTEFGLLDYVPFENLSPKEWEPYADFLKDLGEWRIKNGSGIEK